MNETNLFIPNELTGNPTELPNDNNGIFYLADAFLSIESMTHKKLQKLCYYAKAWHLALKDENIIDDDFEAWVNGAIQPLLFQKYRSYGFQKIPMVLFGENIPDEFIDFARIIFNSYGQFTGEQLEMLNHMEAPWKKARKDLKPWESSNAVISEQDMKDYYRSLL